MRIDNKELKSLIELDRDEKFLNVLADIAKGISDKTSNEVLIKAIENIKNIIDNFSSKQLNAEHATKLLDQIKDNAKNSSSLNKELSSSLINATEILKQNIDNNNKVLEMFAKILEEQKRELVEFKTYLKNNENAEWEFFLRKDNKNVLNYVKAKRIK